MDPINQFYNERRQRIKNYGNDEEMKAKSCDWLQMSMAESYVYNFDWMGRPIIQYPQDMVAMQELVWQVRPDLIIETGIAHGGSLILSSSLLALLELCDAQKEHVVLDPSHPKRKVIGVDIDIRSHNRKAIESHPLANRIELIEGSSIESNTIAKVKDASKGFQKIMVFLDSMHTHDHVLAELENYAPMVSVGSYCVVFDSFVEDMPDGFFKDRPWNIGNNPKTAVWEYLKTHKEFQIDKNIENKLLITVAPDGYLKKTL